MPEEPLDLFQTPEPPPRSFSSLDLPRYRQQLAQLAAHGVCIGTSLIDVSWLVHPALSGYSKDNGHFSGGSKTYRPSITTSPLPVVTSSSVCGRLGRFRINGSINGVGWSALKLTSPTALR
jgi:hypothetical protein